MPLLASSGPAYYCCLIFFAEEFPISTSAHLFLCDVCDSFSTGKDVGTDLGRLAKFQTPTIVDCDLDFNSSNSIQWTLLHDHGCRILVFIGIPH